MFYPEVVGTDLTLHFLPKALKIYGYPCHIQVWWYPSFFFWHNPTPNLFLHFLIMFIPSFVNGRTEFEIFPFFFLFSLPRPAPGTDLAISGIYLPLPSPIPGARQQRFSWITCPTGHVQSVFQEVPSLLPALSHWQGAILSPCQEEIPEPWKGRGSKFTEPNDRLWENHRGSEMGEEDPSTPMGGAAPPAGNFSGF